MLSILQDLVAKASSWSRALVREASPSSKFCTEVSKEAVITFKPLKIYAKLVNMVSLDIQEVSPVNPVKYSISEFSCNVIMDRFALQI